MGNVRSMQREELRVPWNFSQLITSLCWRVHLKRKNLVGILMDKRTQRIVCMSFIVTCMRDQLMCAHKQQLNGVSEGIMEENESISFGIIASSGTSRSLAFEALEQAKQGNFEAADDLLTQSEEASLEAHNIQTKLLCEAAQGHPCNLDILLVHAQDHLMTSILAKELIEQMIVLYKNMAPQEKD